MGNDLGALDAVEQPPTPSRFFLRRLDAGRGDGPPGVWMVETPTARADSDTIRIWGLSPEERVRRTLEAAPADVRAGELAIASDLIVDQKLLYALAVRRNTILLDDRDRPAAACVDRDDLETVASALAGSSNEPGGSAGEEAATAGMTRRAPADLVDTYDPLLRKATPPVATRVRPENVDDIEARLFRASYKGVTDFVTKWVWPHPARAVTRVLARWGVSPNAVTLWSWLLVIAATLLFARGQFGAGLVAAWCMTFLDTVDGKLARVTLRSSRVGHVLDHGLDIVHPPFWYAAWALAVQPAPPWWGAAAGLVIGGYVAGRLLEGLFLLVFRIETHSWRPLDSWFRTVTARRNPNLVLLSGGALLGSPELGLAAVAVWTALSLGFHAVRLLQAATWALRGGVVEPWYLAHGGAHAIVLGIGLCLASAGVRASGLPEPETTPAPAAQSVSTDGVEDPASEPSAPRSPAPRPDTPRGGPPRGIEATPLRSGSASQSWDFAIAFESGHELYVRFLVSNVGIGDNNAAAVWHLITPDGGVHHFKNGRQERGWSLEDGGFRLRVGSSVLSLRNPEPRLEIQKNRVKISLSFSLPSEMLHRIHQPDHTIDIVSLALPVEGSLWFRAGMTDAVKTRGLASLTRVEEYRSDAALRRAEFLSLDPERRWYVSEVMGAAGERRAWAVWLEGETPRVAEAVRVCGPGDGKYPLPRSAVATSASGSARISVDPPFLRYDPLQSLPSVIRFVFPTRPMRLWSRTRLVGRDLRGTFDVKGISRVSFADPVSTKVLRRGATSEAECERDSAS